MGKMNLTTKTKLFALDDWGLSPGINEGIIELAETGHIASVSLMGNQPFLSHSLNRLEELDPELTFHLCFTEGKPLSPPCEVSSLVNQKGYFFSLSAFLLRLYAGWIRPEEIAREAELQLLRLREHVRSPISTIEAHHNVHLVPKIFSAIWPRLHRMGISHYRKIRRGSQTVPLLASYLFDQYHSQIKCGVRPKFVASPSERWLEDLQQLQRFAAHVGHPILLHPAARNDLAEIGSSDSLVGRRSQLDLAKEYIRAFEEDYREKVSEKGIHKRGEHGREGYERKDERDKD